MDRSNHQHVQPVLRVEQSLHELVEYVVAEEFHLHIEAFDAEVVLDIWAHARKDPLLRLAVEVPLEFDVEDYMEPHRTVLVAKDVYHMAVKHQVMLDHECNNYPFPIHPGTAKGSFSYLRSPYLVPYVYLLFVTFPSLCGALVPMRFLQ